MEIKTLKLLLEKFTTMLQNIKTENIVVSGSVIGSSLGVNNVSYVGTWQNNKPVKVKRIRGYVAIEYYSGLWGLNIKLTDTELSQLSMVNTGNGNITGQNWAGSGTQTPTVGVGSNSSFTSPLNNNDCEIITQNSLVFRCVIPLQQIIFANEYPHYTLVAAMGPSFPFEIDWHLSIDYIEL